MSRSFAVSFILGLGWPFLICLPGLLPCQAEDLPHQPDPQTVQLWNFDQGEGRKTSDSVQKVTVDIANCEWGPGRFGKALVFDGKKARLAIRLKVPLSFAGDGSFTIECWIRTSRVGKTQQIFASPNCELEVRKENGQISFNLRGQRGTSTRCTGNTSVVDGKWHHVTAVRDAESKVLKLYVDHRFDVEVEDRTAGQTIVVGHPVFGGKPNGREMFKGSLDEVRISNITRTVAPPTAGENEVKPYVLENDRVRMVFAVGERQVFLASLFDKRSGTEFIEKRLSATRTGNLWSVILRSPDGLSSFDGEQGRLTVKTRERTAGDELVLRWENLRIPQSGGQVSVEATVLLPTGSAFSEWRIRIKNSTQTYGVWTAIFPRLRNLRKLGEDGNDFLAIPGGNGGGAGEGQLYSDPFKTLHPRVRTYPCYHQSMQFNAYYGSEGGLYFSTPDGEMNLKGFHFRASNGKPPALLYEVHHFPANAGVPATGLEVSYPSVIGPFSGDWYDAAQLYRSWALKQKWARLGPLHGRKDISPWIRDGAYWMLLPLDFMPSKRKHLRRLARSLPEKEVRRLARNIDVDSTLAMVREARDYFGFPMTLWCSDWYEGGGDMSPPRYLPMNGLKTFLERMHAEFPKVHFSAYVAPKRYSVQIREYGDEVQTNLENRPDGSPSMGPVMPTETNDQHAYPCWFTPFWQAHWKKKASDRASLGIDGFHVDELASGTSFHDQCFSPNHGHPVGGGTLYANTRRRMTSLLRDSARRARKDFAIHHEALNEIYIDVADAAEVCTSPSNNNIPLYEAVYHDYNFIMGRRILEWTDRNLFRKGREDGDKHIDEFVSSFAQTFVWGNQPGWTRMDIVSYAPRVAGTIRRFMNARYRAMKFLNVGQMMRPLTLTKPLAKVKRIWRRCDTPEHILPVVYNSVWKAADGTIGIVLANITDVPQIIHYRYDLKDSGLNRTPLQIQRIDTASPGDAEKVQETVMERSDSIEGYSVKILEIKPFNQE